MPLCVEGATKSPGELYFWVLFSTLSKKCGGYSALALRERSSARGVTAPRGPLSPRLPLKKFILIFCICSEYMYLIQI